MCTNLQCTAIYDTSELQGKVNPQAYINSKYHNNQLELDIPQLPKTADDAGKAFIAPMCELVNKYKDVLTMPGNLVA